jgi:RNA recognition motif-containing protein
MYQQPSVLKVRENFYIGSLPGLVDGSQLRRYLSQFGEIISLEIIKDACSGKCKGYAFLSINLSVSESQFLNMRHIYDERVIFVRQKLHGGDLKAHKEDFQHKRLYVSTFSKTLSDEDLHRYFSYFGRVELAYFVKNYGKQKERRMFGYVNFQNDDAVRNVLAHPRHHISGQEVFCEGFKSKKRELNKEVNKHQTPLQQQAVSPSVQQVQPTQVIKKTLSKQVTIDSSISYEKSVYSGVSDFRTSAALINQRHSPLNVRFNQGRRFLLNDR